MAHLGQLRRQTQARYVHTRNRKREAPLTLSKGQRKTEHNALCTTSISWWLACDN